ncbi:Protein-lysine N-methyltransferase [Nymphaea thermarum]|nr:Protein-lysine N-methyltransferase [Nymphaea thermarum]
MAGIRWPPEDAEPVQTRALTTSDLISDDDRSVAADSWSVKSDYGSTLDDEQRQVDASDVLSSGGTFRAASDYSSDKDEPEAEMENSMLGLLSYWESIYTDEIANFHENGHVGEVWFGVEVMETIAVWIKNLCANFHQGHSGSLGDGTVPKPNPGEEVSKVLASWSVLDIGTGNGLFLQELAKQGFSDLTGIDYCDGAINLARNVADRDGCSSIKFLIDDVLETKLEKQYQLVTDKGALDSIGLHPDGAARRLLFWGSVSKLVAPGGILVITTCNTTKDGLVQEAESFHLKPAATDVQVLSKFRYLDHIDSYPSFSFGGLEGRSVATVALERRLEA